MKQIKQTISIAAILVITGSLSGCLEVPEITIFEPGVYKGSKDPLLGNIDDSALQQRFQNQMDR